MRNSFNTSDDVTETLSSPFTINEIASVCTRLANKSPGYDRICNESLKNGGHALFETLCYIFNAMISYDYIPPALKHSIIVPIFKGTQKPKTALN